MALYKSKPKSRPRAGRTTTVLVGFVRRRAKAQALHHLAKYLNGEVPLGYVAPVPEGLPEDEARAWSEERERLLREKKEERAAWEEARVSIEECQGLSPTAPLPLSAIRRFNGLARQSDFIFHIWRYYEPPEVPHDTDDVFPGGGREIIPMRELWDARREPGRSKVVLGLNLLSSNRRGYIVKLLADFLMNTARNRLKRCPHCQRWFVDETRNNFAKRCSRACTWAWWTRDRRRRSRHAQYLRKGRRRRAKPKRAIE